MYPQMPHMGKRDQLSVVCDQSNNGMIAQAIESKEPVALVVDARP